MVLGKVGVSPHCHNVLLVVTHMPFVYRLEKILHFRIRKRDEQLEKVRKAQMEVARVEGMIQANLEQVKKSREEMKICDPLMMAHYDNFLQHLYQNDIALKEQKQAAIRFLREQMQILQELEQAVKVLEKHKEKKLDEYKEEQKYIEMKQLNEVGSLKHYARKIENEQEELEELRKLGIDPNEQGGY